MGLWGNLVSLRPLGGCDPSSNLGSPIQFKMKIKKLIHCCLLIEEKGLRILTDPGTYLEEPENINKIDLIIITHEHQDHLHIGSLKAVIKNNPKAKIFTNKAVGKLLDAEKINYELLENNQKKVIKGVSIEAFGHDHAHMYKIVPCMNTGYFIADKLFYPGDSFHKPPKSVDILALPVAGPWLKISESIDYALDVSPKIAFPVHEGMLKKPGSAHRLPPTILEPKGIKFVIIEEGKEIDFSKH